MPVPAAPVDCAVSVAVELLACGRGVRFSAPGGSMRPAIRGGETIIAAPAAPGDIAPGDIILFLRGTRLVAHRVLRIAAGEGGAPRFLTRGDAAAAPDRPFEAADVLGRVVAVERRGRRIDLATRHGAWSGRIARCLAAARRAARRMRAVMP